MKTKKDADYIFYELTRSICPKCKKLIDAEVVLKDNKVYMKKYCPSHGFFEALISSDAGMYLSSLKYNKPGTIPLNFTSEIKDGCPSDCGICPNHKQHTCLGIIEISDYCNVNCPVCFANSSNSYSLSLDKIEEMVGTLVKCEGNPEVLQISGGEPTLHPQLNEIVSLAKFRGIKYVTVNTNGIKLADEEYAKKLAEVQPNIYLQFDGFDSKSYQQIRGVDLSRIKIKAIENCEKYKMNVTLVPTVIKNVNDWEVGEIVKFAVKKKIVRGIMFQPVTYAGRNNCINPLDRITLQDLLVNIENQTSGIFKASDFVPIPCPYPTCSYITYAYVNNGGVTPLTRVVNVEDYLDYFSNRAVVDLDDVVQDALEGLWSASAIAGTDKSAKNYCNACGITLPNIEEIKEKVKLIGAMWFMDEYTFDLKRAMKCCIHEILPNGKMMPLCVYNTLYREKLASTFKKL